MTYDLAGHPTRVSDAQGYASQLTLDTEGKVKVAGLYEPNQAQPLRATYRWYDEQNRLAKQLRADGRIDTYAYDAEGRPIEHLDGDGVLHLVRSNTLDTLQARLDLTPDGLMRVALRRHTEPGQAPIAGTELRDDFGRQLVLLLPDHGAKVARYDAADRLIQMTQADRSMTEYRYDTAGRLTEKITRQAPSASGQTVAPRQTTPPRQTVPPRITSLRYQGAQLAEIKDPAQTTAYAYDAAGRVAQTTVTLMDADGQPVSTTTTATSYDSQTRQPHSRTLADGQVLHIQRDAATQVAQALELQRPAAHRAREFIAGLPAWLHWMQAALPRTVVAQDIRFHPFNGITGYTDGHGIRTDKSFDIAGRLTRLTVGTRPADLFNMSIFNVNYNYGVGPKIREMRAEDAAGKFITTDYRYGGFGALQSDEAKAPTLLKTSLAAATPAPEQRDRLGRVTDDGHTRYSYTADGQVDTVRNASGQPIASYRYNSFAQRVSKTVFGPDQLAVTTYFLWQNHKLVAELDGQGRITSQYLYLSDGGRAAPVAKIESAVNPDNASHRERILSIHTDHRGAPVAMTDDTRKLVWQAELTPRGQAALTSQEATLNLRLPGQYFDAETGLHDNLHRSYNPSTGRYLQPDPLGYPDGPDAYLYASGDPINKVDPLGLYEIDVHYYMTYFLAVAAGMRPDDASTLALAAQYIDDNPNTAPIKLSSFASQEERLMDYHFTLWNWDWTDPVAAVHPTVYSTNPNLTDPLAQSAQLTGLRSYATPPVPVGSCAQPNNTSVQLMGEFLHAFEDSFGHRNQTNVPIAANIGFGHLVYGHNPDYTYNHDIPIYGRSGVVIGFDRWQNNESRTMKMELDTYSQIVDYMTSQNFYSSGRVSGNTISGAELQETLRKFNLTTENEDNTNGFTTAKGMPKKRTDTMSEKLKMLNKVLARNGFASIPPYNVQQACQWRQQNLANLKQVDYAGAILATPPACTTVRPGIW